MYPFAFSLAGLCAVEFRLHYPLVPASGVPLAWRRRPQPTHGTAARGAGRAVRGARRACRLLSRLYFPPPRGGSPGCGPRVRVRVSQSVLSVYTVSNEII